MQTNDPAAAEQIAARIAALQKSYILLQEQSKNDKNTVERDLDEAALRIIDILDLITANSYTDKQIIINKIEKRLLDLLRRWQVQEIIFKDGKIEVGKARVMETRSAVDMPTGTILEVCRKGYQRGAKTIRSADVITSG